MDIDNNEILWQNYNMDRDRPLKWMIGNLQLMLKQENDDVWLSHQYRKDDEDESAGKRGVINNESIGSSSPEPSVEELERSRWALPRNVNIVSLKPSFPQLPIVICPENPFRLFPGVDAQIYVCIPICINLCIPDENNLALIKISSVELSYTWFGTFTEGNLCYWISSSARRQIEVDLYRNYLVICPIHIQNNSNEELFVEKLCLHVEGLEIFQDKNQLWSNVTKVSYNGSDHISDIKIIKGPPTEIPHAKMIVESSKPTKKGFSTKTFLALKNLPGIGTHFR